MEETKLRQLFKNRADAYLNTIDESVEQGMSEDCFIKAVSEAINYTHCCKSDSELLPKRLSASAYTQAMSGNYEEFVKWWDSKS
jgi:hypothetical protein